MNKNLFLFAFVMAMLAVHASIVLSCQESFEEKAQREAMDYTRKFCPTPVINYMRTDSVTFDKSNKLYTYFCTFIEKADNQGIIDKNKATISETFRNTLKESVTMKKYLEMGVKFRMVGRSEKDKRKVLLVVNL